jgi:hypothetical protein
VHGHRDENPSCQRRVVLQSVNATFKGVPVLLEHPSNDSHDCPHPADFIEVVHHYDGAGLHYCPTGFIMCSFCGAVGNEPGDPECTRWGR